MKTPKVLWSAVAAVALLSCTDFERLRTPFQVATPGSEGDSGSASESADDPDEESADEVQLVDTASETDAGEPPVDTIGDVEPDAAVQGLACPTTCTTDVPCEISTCNPATGQCETAAVADGAVCSDGSACTGGDACQGGACLAGPQLGCDDGNPCTDDSCEDSVGCMYSANSIPCSDGDLCTVGDHCSAGACSPSTWTSCADDDACTSDKCDTNSGVCVHVAMNCDDANQCTVDSCAPGTCKHAPAQDGTACGQNLACSSGVCSGKFKVVQVAMGKYTACALRNDGTVWCWGEGAILGSPLAISDTPTPTQIQGLNDIVAIDVGSGSACALSSTGKVWCWGRNDYGIVGQALLGGGSVYVASPSQVTLTEAAVDVACGRATSCAVLVSGKVACWGSNATGELGAANVGIPYPNSSEKYSWLPVVVAGSANAVEVDVGWNHACARLKDGGCACWGSNSNGQLALDPNGTKQAGWSKVQNLADVAQLALGLAVSCIRRSGGTAACWGYGATYQLGNGTQLSVHAPEAVALVEAVKDLACSPFGDGCIAVATAGAVYTWGVNDYNVQGTIGITASNAKPNLLGNLAPSVAVGAGQSARCSIDTEGSLWCWGRNLNGELGAGQMGNVKNPLKIYDSVDKAISLSAAYDKMCLVTESSKTLCWGEYSVSEPTVFAAAPGDAAKVILGTYNPAWLTSTGKALFGWSPPGVQFDGKVDFVANGGCVCGISAGQLECWCFTNTYGQQGDGTKVTVKPVAPKLVPLAKPVLYAASGFSHTCAVLSDQSAWCWGDNSAGQLGIGESGSGKLKTSPAAITSVSGFSSIFAAGSDTCAIKAGSGSVYCWGKCDGKTCTALASSPQTTPLEIGLFNATQVALGPTHMCALKAGGLLYCWGSTNSGQTGTQNGDLPAPAFDQVAEVAAASSATCALRTDGTVWCWGANNMGLVGNGFAFTPKAKKVVKIP